MTFKLIFKRKMSSDLTSFLTRSTSCIKDDLDSWFFDYTKNKVTKHFKCK